MASSTPTCLWADAMVREMLDFIDSKKGEDSSLLGLRKAALTEIADHLFGLYNIRLAPKQIGGKLGSILKDVKGVDNKLDELFMNGKQAYAKGGNLRLRNAEPQSNDEDEEQRTYRGPSPRRILPRPAQATQSPQGPQAPTTTSGPSTQHEASKNQDL